MTLIAGFFKNGVPIIMGDLLVSDNDQSEKILTLPSVGEISKQNFSDGQYSPSHLCQKALLLSSKLSICWAGNKRYASCFVKEIIKNNLHKNPSYDALQTLYNEIVETDNFSIIGLYRDGTEMRIFDFNSLPVLDLITNPEFGYFKATGSGYGALLETMPNLKMNISSGDPNKLEQGISTALLLSSSLLSQELMTRSSLQELFGVGYEIIHPLGSGLNKFTDISYVFWQAEETTPGKWQLLPFPFVAFKYSYIGDFLVIRSVRCSSNSKNPSCNVDSDEIHVVNPIHRDIDPETMIGYKPESLNSKWICNIFLWKNFKKETGAYAQFGNTPQIIWRNEFKKDEGISVNTEFIKSSLVKIASMTTEIKEKKL
jgi:hypothetical protein